MEKEGSYFIQVAIVGGSISKTTLFFMLARYVDKEK